jgi:Uncharacterised nucleotidyltransferase
MARSGVPGASPKSLQDTLARITETLAAALSAAPQTTPDWTDFEWSAAQAVAAMHGISPLLSKTACWAGPAAWAEFLRSQRSHTALRHVRISELLQRLDIESRKAGVAALPLKGAALHAMGLYSAGDRPMADIDLLVRPADVAMMSRVLASLGFHLSEVTWKERVFIPVANKAPGVLGEDSGNDLKVELHDKICERLPWRLTDATGAIFPSSSRPGLNPYSSVASLMLHLLLHAAGSMPTKTLRLMHLHDIAMLSSRMSTADWEELRSLESSELTLWWAFPPLRLAARYFPAMISQAMLDEFVDKCPWLLRRLPAKSVSEVSLSYLWVDAFPGIEWSRSVSEGVEYALNRLRPSSTHLAARENHARSQSWAQQSEWSRLPQWRRILRWATARQMRPATMHAVNSALSHVG